MIISLFFILIFRIKILDIFNEEEVRILLTNSIIQINNNLRMNNKLDQELKDNLKREEISYFLEEKETYYNLIIAKNYYSYLKNKEVSYQIEKKILKS